MFLTLLGVEVRIELFEHLVACAVEIDFQILQNLGGNPFTLTEQAEQDMLGSDIRML